MNINFYDLYYTVIKNRDEKDIVEVDSSFDLDYLYVY